MKTKNKIEEEVLEKASAKTKCKHKWDLIMSAGFGGSLFQCRKCMKCKKGSA